MQRRKRQKCAFQKWPRQNHACLPSQIERWNADSFSQMWRNVSKIDKRPAAMPQYVNATKRQRRQVAAGISVHPGGCTVLTFITHTQCVRSERRQRQRQKQTRQTDRNARVFQCFFPDTSLIGTEPSIKGAELSMTSTPISTSTSNSSSGNEVAIGRHCVGAIVTRATKK